MNLADIVQRKLTRIARTILADLPKRKRSNRVYSNVGSRHFLDVVAHLDHRVHLRAVDLPPGTDPYNQVLGSHNRNEIDPILEPQVHLLYEIFPHLGGHSKNFAEVELFKEVFFFEAGAVDGIGSHVFDGEDVFMSLFFKFAVALGVVILIIFTLPLLVFSVLAHNLQNSEKSSSRDVDNVLVEFQLETPVTNVLSTLLIVLVEVGLLLQLDPSCREASRIQR